MYRLHITSATRAMFLALALVSLAFAPARAQGTGRSMDIDVSIRSAALGGAGAALSWDDLDHWANPALLGYAQGVRYINGHTQLVPGLASDVFFDTDVVQVGYGGIGVVFSGKPFDAGGVRLDYGWSEGRDAGGNFTGMSQSWETVKSAGVGVSLARTLETAMRAGGGPALPLSRYGDVSLGMNWKDVTIQLAPAAMGGVGSTSARDEGIHARVTPYDGFASDMSLPFRLDLAYGASVLSYNDDVLVTFINEDQPSPVTRFHKRATAARISAGRLPIPPLHAAGTLHRALIEGLTPLLAFSFADEHDKVGTLDDIQYETDGSGFEVAIANLFTYRRGHYEDLVGQIDGDTWGWGAGLRLGGLGGVRYDDAHWPQARDPGLGVVHRNQWSVWLDPLGIYRGFGRRGGAGRSI